MKYRLIFISFPSDSYEKVEAEDVLGEESKSDAATASGGMKRYIDGSGSIRKLR